MLLKHASDGCSENCWLKLSKFRLRLPSKVRYHEMMTKVLQHRPIPLTI